VIKLKFTCGHTGTATGNEEVRPVCPIDGAAIERVTAPAPSITYSKDIKPVREN
jgi:hypothetical protein